MNGADLVQGLRRAGLEGTPVGEATNARFPAFNERCNSVRTVLAGGELMKLLNHPTITPLERIFRRIPPAGPFTATPAAPVFFELGALEVPKQMVFVLLEYRFAVYIPSGVVAGDFEELEDRRLSTSVGYDVLFTEKRRDNVRYELTPSLPRTDTTETFAPGNNPGFIPGQGLSTVDASVFQRLRSSNTRNTVGSALSTLPQRHRREAQLGGMPFTYVVPSGQRVNFQTKIFQGIPFPVAFFESEMSGMFMPANTLHEFLKTIAPCSSSTEGR
jgi:hypothetical protein